MPHPASTGRLPARGSDPEWERRCARLFEDLRRPAAAMVRRAFGGAFCDAEIEDLYGAAWLGTLRALDRRRTELDDEALRRYVMTAVANQASKELRRRRRRPTVQLEAARTVADAAPTPDERAADGEEARVARDVLGSLPARRRAVVMLRYGWGLAPREVCALVAGLSPRAYRKEITRGVEELGSKLSRRLHGLGGAAAWTAKLAAAGAPKLVATCLGTGAAATACVVVGLGSTPIVGSPDSAGGERRGAERAHTEHAVAHPAPAPPVAAGEHGPAAAQTAEEEPSEPAVPVAPEPATQPPPAGDREFGLVAGGGRGEGSHDAGGAAGGSAAREFGP